MGDYLRVTAYFVDSNAILFSIFNDSVLFSLWNELTIFSFINGMAHYFVMTFIISKLNYGTYAF